MSTAEQTMPVKNQVSEEEWRVRVDLAACYPHLGARARAG